MTLSFLPKFLPRRFVSALETDGSQKGLHLENTVPEEGLRSCIQSKQPWQLATCEQGHYPARADNHESPFLSSSSQSPDAAASARLHNMHRLSCGLPWLSQKIEDITFHVGETLLDFLGGGESECFLCMLSLLDYCSKWWTQVSSWVTTRSINSSGSSSPLWGPI